jgi:hypothetical protein
MTKIENYIDLISKILNIAYERNDQTLCNTSLLASGLPRFIAGHIKIMLMHKLVEGYKHHNM